MMIIVYNEKAKIENKIKFSANVADSPVWKFT